MSIVWRNSLDLMRIYVRVIYRIYLANELMMHCVMKAESRHAPLSLTEIRAKGTPNNISSDSRVSADTYGMMIKSQIHGPVN